MFFFRTSKFMVFSIAPVQVVAHQPPGVSKHLPGAWANKQFVNEGPTVYASIFRNCPTSLSQDINGKGRAHIIGCKSCSEKIKAKKLQFAFWIESSPKKETSRKYKQKTFSCEKKQNGKL
jgi:hypothetical protein